MLEFDGQSLDPAIVSAQPMKSAQMVCAPGKDGEICIFVPKRLCMFVRSSTRAFV